MIEPLTFPEAPLYTWIDEPAVCPTCGHDEERHIRRVVACGLDSWTVLPNQASVATIEWGDYCRVSRICEEIWTSRAEAEAFVAACPWAPPQVPR